MTVKGQSASRSPSPALVAGPAIVPQPPPQTRQLLWKLYTSHTLSTWNARSFEFGAVLFLAAIFPGTLFFASCYALFRAAAATILGPWLGTLVDSGNRLFVIRQSIIWQRLSVACSCLILMAMLSLNVDNTLLRYCLFGASVLLACLEKLAFIGNTIAVERDWIIVVADSLMLDRQGLNSGMRRIDLACKLIAPLCIGLLDGYSTKIAIWTVFAQNMFSVLVEYYAIAQVYNAVPQLGLKGPTELQTTDSSTRNTQPPSSDLFSGLKMGSALQPWKLYAQNPAFLASFSLSLLYLTVLSFASQMTTYLLTLGFTSTHVSLMRLISVILELSATCAAPILMNHIGAVRSGLWFVNEQLLTITAAVALFALFDERGKLAGAALVIGVCLSRLGLWGFDLCVQYLVQEDAPEQSRGSFSAIEMSLQNLFELISFATTMIWYKPESFKIPVYISVGAIATSAACFAGFVRQKRGHLLHADRCFKRMGKRKIRLHVLPTIEEEEVEMQGLLAGD